MTTPWPQRFVGQLALPVAFSVFALSCSSDGGSQPPSPSTVSSAMIGPAGGVLFVDSGPFAGAEIVIPPGALGTTTEIRVVQSPDTFLANGAMASLGLPGTLPASAVLGIEPNGLELNERATVTLPGGFVPDPTGGGDPLARREKLMVLRPSSDQVEEAFLTASGEWQLDELGVVFALSYGGDLPFPAEQFVPNGPVEAYDFGPLFVIVEEASRLSGVTAEGAFVYSQTPGRPLAPAVATLVGIPPAPRTRSEDFLILQSAMDGSVGTFGFGTEYQAGRPITGDELVLVDGAPLEVLPAVLVTGFPLPPASDGEVSLTVTFGSREPFETPGGVFPDTLPVTLSFSGARVAQFQFVLAFGQGPIASRVDGLGSTDGMLGVFQNGARSTGRLQRR